MSVAPQAEVDPEAEEDDGVIEPSQLEIITKATIGFTKIDITDNSHPFHFGKWNQRVLVKSKTKELLRSMEENGVQWYLKEALLPLVVKNTEYIDATSFTKDITMGPKLPTMKLTPAGVAKMKTYFMASGQHRLVAI